MLKKKEATSVLQTVFSRKMVVALLMGFSSGVPLMLTLSVLQAWMKKEGLDLSVIGAMSLVGIPYTIKFLWAPFLDRFTLPFLGRRRGWLLVIQIILMAAIGVMALAKPAQHPIWVAVAAFLVAFFSASQDVVIDAYRREDLTDTELGLGSALYINGYRVGMLLVSGGGLILADHVGFPMVYAIMALCMLPGIFTTLKTPEPQIEEGAPSSMKEAVWLPLNDFFHRNGALWILAFILLYKIGDTMALAMTTPFYLDIGFTNTEIGTVVKLFGFWAVLGGAFLGGLILLRIGIYRGLWAFGILQIVSTSGFIVLASVGYSLPLLATVVAGENLASGMGTAAYAAFMASMTNRRFTATQYALLSSIMGIPRVLLAAPTGWIAKHTGWVGFFGICVLIAIPGLLLLFRFKSWQTPSSSTA